MRGIVYILVAVGSIGAITGCLPNHQAPIKPREAPTVAERNFQTTWDASIQTLRKYQFPVDRKDPRAGVMTTEAVLAGHLFELWHRDATSRQTYSENSMQNILRAVKVTLVPLEDMNHFDVDVTVRVARVNRKEPQITDASQFRNVRMSAIPKTLRYSDLLPRKDEPIDPKTQERLRVTGTILPDHILVPLGRDEELERRIARDIRAKIGLPAGLLESARRAQPTPAPAPKEPTPAPEPLETMAAPEQPVPDIPWGSALEPAKLSDVELEPSKPATPAESPLR